MKDERETARLSNQICGPQNEEVLRIPIEADRHSRLITVPEQSCLLVGLAIHDSRKSLYETANVALDGSAPN